MVSIPYKTQGDAVAVTVIEIKYKKQQFTLDVFCIVNKDVFMFHTFTVDLSKYHQCVCANIQKKDNINSLCTWYILANANTQ